MAGSGSRSGRNETLIILCVDNEQNLLDTGRHFLEQTREFRIDILISAREALKSSYLHSHDAIISDYQEPDMDRIVFFYSNQGTEPGDSIHPLR